MAQRVNLIEAVTNPLGVFVLVLLIIEATLLANLMAIPEDLRGFVLYAAVALVVLIIMLVAVIAIWRPDALYGRNRFDDDAARSLAVDVYHAFAMYVSNLSSSDERLEAYKSIVALIEGGGSASDSAMRQTMANAIRNRASILDGS